MDLKLFVIIVTYKGKQWYDRCFASLRESTIPMQTIVVDNASEDGSVEYIREHYPEIVLLENKENLGFGQANNLAMRYALDHDCDYVFLLNQDTWIEPDAIEKLVNVHQQHSEYGILSPMHLRADRRSLYMQLIDGNNNNPNKELLSDIYCGTLRDVYPMRFVNAAAWLLPRNTLEKVGGFDPIFVHYVEDVDYANRVHYHRLRIGVCPSARIVHDHQKTANPFSPQVNKQRNHAMLTMRLIDPNVNTSLFKQEFYLLKKCMLNLFKGEMKLYKSFRSDCSFVIANRKRLKVSMRNNRKSQPSWL